MRDIKRYTDDYNQPNFEDYQVMYRRKKVLEVMEKYHPKRIIEIGCGREPLFQYIDWEYDCYVVVEPSENFFNNAKELSKGKDRVICYHEYFSSSDKLKEIEADFVICSSLLHELEQPVEFLKSVAYICKANTVVHINVPNAYSLHRMIAKEIGMIEDLHDMSERNKLYQQHSVYDLETLKVVTELAGFVVIEEGTYFVKPFTHGQMYNMISNKIINEEVLDGLYQIGKFFPKNGSEIFLNLNVLCSE